MQLRKSKEISLLSLLVAKQSSSGRPAATLTTMYFLVILRRKQLELDNRTILSMCEKILEKTARKRVLKLRVHKKYLHGKEDRYLRGKEDRQKYTSFSFWLQTSWYRGFLAGPLAGLVAAPVAATRVSPPPPQPEFSGLLFWNRDSTSIRTSNTSSGGLNVITTPISTKSLEFCDTPETVGQILVLLFGLLRFLDIIIP